MAVSRFAWDADRLERLQAMLDKGMRPGEAGKALGTKADTVRKAIARYKLRYAQREPYVPKPSAPWPKPTGIVPFMDFASDDFEPGDNARLAWS